MIMSEFRAWFEGYTEGLEGAPTKAQFDRIKEKVKEIDGTPVTQTIYIDRYVPQFPASQRYYGGYPYWSATGGGGGGGGYATGGAGNTAGASGQMFNSHAAMNALGKAEAQMMAA